MEAPTEDEFLKEAKAWETGGHPGYVAFVRWLKGKCFKTMPEAERAYAERGVTRI